MLYHILDYISPYTGGGLMFMHSVILRSLLAAITAFSASLLAGPSFIQYLRNQQVAQVVRQEGPASHLRKQGTPTMGGILIVACIVFSSILWGDCSNSLLWLALFITVSFGAIGFYDDWLKVAQKNTRGLSAKAKITCQMLLVLIVSVYLYTHGVYAQNKAIFLPYTHITWHIGYLYMFWIFLVIVGSSNGVNLTDGLDGLAAVPCAVVALGLGVLAYWSGNHAIVTAWHMPVIGGIHELSIFCAAIVGASLGFLWFNLYPAKVFMGDVGSLSLGAALGGVAVMLHHELAYMVMAGVFVLEAVSVIIQVASFKLRGKRVFKMAPLHHHFELLGLPETQVIGRFWIVSCFLVGIILLLLSL